MKNDVSNELKVGIAIIVFALAIFFVLYFMGDIKRETGKPYVIQFNQVGGINPGDRVRYAGVDVGKVKDVTIKPAQIYLWDSDAQKFEKKRDENGKPVVGDQAFITILITEENIFKTNFPIFTENTVVTIATSLMNEKWIEIKPQPGEPTPKGEVILGHSPTSLEDFMAKAEKAVDQIESATANIDQILGDPETQRDIKMSLKNFEELTSNLKEASATASGRIDEITRKIARVADNANAVLVNVNSKVNSTGQNLENMTATLDRIARTNEGDIREIVKNLNTTSKSLNKSLGVIEELVTQEGFSEDILSTLKNIKTTSEEVAGIAGDIRAITSDGKIREDLKVTVHEARGAVTSANRLLSGINNTLGLEDEDSSNGSAENGGNDNGAESGGEVKFPGYQGEESENQQKDSQKKNGDKISFSKLIQANLEVEYNDVSKETVPNANVVFLPQNKSSVKLGVDSIGFDNLWNLQYRMKWGNIYPRLGVVRSKLGGGADIQFGRNYGVYVDAYNPRDWHVDLTGRITVMKDFYLHGGVRDVTDTKQTVFGVGKRF
ncbi:MAG: MlaD family protein [Vulcanimicrobiota bacterium]